MSALHADVTAGARRVTFAAPVADRWRQLRDRLLASPRFRHFATRFAPTRGIARRHARALFDLCAGFVYSQVLQACVRLDVFALLAAGPRDVAALAPALGLTEDAAERLLAAAASLDLVERRGEHCYGLGPLGAALCGDPAIARMVEHHALLYADLADPVALLRAEAPDTALARFWAYARSGQPGALAPEQVAAYTKLMASTQSLVAGEILDAYPVGRHRCLLDVGGGNGTFLAAAAARAPHLRLVLFDLPAVAVHAREHLAAAGLEARARVVGGDFRTTPLPVGADVVSLVRVLHDHDDATVLALLQAVRRALPDRGTLLVAEPMAATPGAAPVGDAYFGFYLLAMGRGRPRSAHVLSALLAEAGFRRIRPVATPLPLQTSLVVAQA